MIERSLQIPKKFQPPIVLKESRGVQAFLAYDWYFEWMQRHLKNVKNIFLTPCAATKPIFSSSLHRSVYQKFSLVYGKSRERLVVSEPVVLIRYSDLYDLEKVFCYDFPPRLLSFESRNLFVERLRLLLLGKNIVGCLPKHHAKLVTDAIGEDWKNYWCGDMFSMIRKASKIKSKNTL